MNDILLHYGTKRRSGRYKWGSGLNPYQHELFGFLDTIDNMRAEGKSDKEIAASMGLSTTQMRAKVTLANREEKRVRMLMIEDMHKEGLNNVEIAKQLDISEASVRNYLKKNTNEGVKETMLDSTADMLKRSLDKNPYLDIGAGVERQIGISKEKLRAAKDRLIAEGGYYEHTVWVRQMADPKKWTTIKVLSKEPDIKKVNANKDKIRSMEEWTDDGGITFRGLEKIKPVSMDRIKIRYAEEGGILKDGLIELRRNVDDLDLGTAKYAQVRIATPDKRYLKGMAIYSDDLPDGVDIIFNTNKKVGLPAKEVLKKMSDNEDNPFGSTIMKQKGALNIVNEEGTWNTWSTKMSSQFLSKQPVALVKERLKDTFDSIRNEYDEIMGLTNPVVKKHMMNEFTNGLDAKARDLKAKGMARTKSHVLLPFPDMDPSEVYAPNYKNGEKVVLVRHPHGGTFEIPQLTVNNKAKSPKKALKNAIDGIGIHPSIAEKLSGADFDGDTVLVIPNNSGKIKHKGRLEYLKKFDPKAYARDYETMTKKHMQIEMGKASNLITDMTIKGADDNEIARATAYSMVVIDAHKHKLDHKKAKEDLGISALVKKYQERLDPETGKIRRGASTLISRAKNEQATTVDEIVYIDKKTGKEVVKKAPSTKKPQMDMVDDAYKLSSGSEVENTYAEYANKIKALKNESIKASSKIPGIKRDPTAAKKYAAEVESIDKKLNDALLNAPRERLVQLQANKAYYKNLTPDMDKEDRKKLRTQVLAASRAKIIPGPDHKKAYVELTDNEWEAIQNGAISQQKLKDILNNSKSDHIRKLATPKESIKMSPSKITKAKMLLDKGYTISEVAENLGVSTTTIREVTK